MSGPRRAILLVTLFVPLLLAACGGRAPTEPIETEVTRIVEGTEEVAEEPEPEETEEVAEGPGSTPSPPPATPVASPQPAPSPTAPAEERVVELEWPPEMRLGDSDIVRLSLIPAGDGYTVRTDFPDHQTLTETLPLETRPGHDLSAVARLDTLQFRLSEEGEWEQRLLPGKPVTWQWLVTPTTGGQHRLLVRLALRWRPRDPATGATREAEIYSRGVTVQVRSFLGLNQQQATMAGIVGLFLGSTLSLPLLLYSLRPQRRKLVELLDPSRELVIERAPAIELGAEEERLLRALFHRYGRLLLQGEFRSGYSGARIFLALPIRPDGRADAYTIAKVGERPSIEQEFENYETFVKDTLPPITARIQDRPVALSPIFPPLPPGGRELAALRYTFIGEPGRMPTSLRQALLADPDPELLEQLFRTFGPNWWMQRRPHTFRLSQEYDRMLPSHYILVPTEAQSADITLDGEASPPRVSLEVGTIVTLRHFQVIERRFDEGYVALVGRTVPGYPPLRLRWLLPDREAAARAGAGCARVVATRASLLHDLVEGFERHGLPDPLVRLPELLDEQVSGTRSAIHGDLNLENALVGPGAFLWLIDFALTREGHPLYDLAHLEAEIIAHILAPRVSTVEFLELLHSGSEPLLVTLRAIARRCLFNPEQPREYHLALYATCLGALKYSNLSSHSKQLLYLTAAHLVREL